MAVTLAYLNLGGGTTPPTAAQAALINTLLVDVIASADADTTATITHNFNTSVADLALGFPIVSVTQLISQALTALSAWAVTSITTTTVVLTKLTSTGSGNAAPQIRVAIAKPHSIVK
jgi:hypothetical protein